MKSIEKEIGYVVGKILSVAFLLGSIALAIKIIDLSLNYIMSLI